LQATAGRPAVFWSRELFSEADQPNAGAPEPVLRAYLVNQAEAAVLCCIFMLEPRQISDLLLPYLDGHPLAVDQLGVISTYIDLILKWNRVINLTAIRQPDQVVRRHFGESLFAARHLLAPEAADSVIDLGSGAGFPGVVFKIFAPSIRLTLVESHGKKAIFLRELVRTLHLSDVQVVQERAEHLQERAALITFRAVEKFESILCTAASLVAPGGRVGALIGASQLTAAASVLHGRWRSVAIPESKSRVLAIWQA
jgi:16S rRNA (guanine527-N7)-methyltransferase